jgi:uncharacterized membrane protein YeiH
VHSYYLFILVDIIGIFAFALSGFLVGVRNGLDILGLLIAASLTALGGGIIRDTILSIVPFAFKTLYPALTLLASLLIAFAIRLYRFSDLEKKWLFIVSDTIGLVAFSISGALLGMKADYNFFGVIILSFITAVGGGVMRDILINQVPVVLKSDFYGSVSVIVAALLLLFHGFHAMNETTLLLTAIFGIVLRLIAYKYKWHLPQLQK